ncbi:beta family protein [Nonomuraea sp. CA-141351]|uniref:beta family protein n=1 Tax=Nonomuraea sp. CA-141351 TaxID=3239996 RepID=UPI003D8CE053
MTVYRPIFKGREAEFRALENIPSAHRSNTMPIIEAIAGKGGEGRGLYSDALKLGKEIHERIPDDLRVAIDCQHLVRQHGRPDAGGAVQLVSEVLQLFRCAMTPVFRLTDDSDDLDDVAHAVQVHQLHPCLRLPWRGPRRAPQDAHMSGRLRRMGLAFNEVDLLIDLWAVESDHAASEKACSAHEALDWAAGIPWRSVTLAVGGFPPPETVAAMPFDTPTRVPRRDAHLWASVVPKNRRQEIGYADYGAATARMPTGPRRARHPKLCYTVEDQWAIYRCAAGEGVGAFNCFRKLCTQVVASDGWPPQGAAFSWGDQHIEMFAEGGRTQPNSAASWRAFAQSHHLAVIWHRLDTDQRP